MTSTPLASEFRQVGTLYVWTRSAAKADDVLVAARSAISATRGLDEERQERASSGGLIAYLYRLFGRRPVADHGRNEGQSDAVVGFTYTRNACRFFLLGKDGIPRYCPMKNEKGESNTAVSFVEAYEGRIFCPHFELRWLQDGSDRRLALWAEDKAAERIKTNLPDSFKLDARPGQRALPNEYLLWGARAPEGGQSGGLEDGWVKLTSARIGPLYVPIDRAKLKEQRGVKLETCEYFKCEEDGNWVYAGERLIRLAGADRPHKEGSPA